MPIVRHDPTGKVTPRSRIIGESTQDIIDKCSHDELNADLSRRQTPYDEFLAELRTGGTHGTDRQ